VAAPGRRRRFPHDRRIQLLALGAGLPGLVLAAVLLAGSDLSPRTQWTLLALVAVFWLGFASSAREAVSRPLQTLSNLLGALREEDFSFRARVGRRDDPLGQALSEVNSLAQTLREQRLGALEATALLRKVMEEIDVAVFAFDATSKLQLANRAGERLLGAPAERLVGLDAAALGLAPFLEGEAPRIAEASFAGTSGRFDLRRGTFRQRGKPMQLLVLADVSRALRDEERQAWQRLIRPRPAPLGQPLRPVLHDEARGLGHRPGAVPPDRRGSRRHAVPREPSRGRLPGHAAPAAATRVSGARGRVDSRPCPLPRRSWCCSRTSTSSRWQSPRASRSYPRAARTRGSACSAASSGSWGAGCGSCTASTATRRASCCSPRTPRPTAR
jgi:PAS domain-containing protein